MGGTTLKSGHLRIVVALLAELIAAASVLAQQKPEYDMGKMQMLFLEQSSEWKTGDRADEIRKEHRAYIEGLITNGKLALWGEVASEGGLREIGVVKTESIEEARALTQLFPAVKAGMLKADVLSWYAARNLIKPPQAPLTRSGYVFGVLVRGPKSTREQTEETKKIQEGHMANIDRLAETGKLVLAGPFVDGGDRRGVFIFKVDTLSEAQALTDTDPAVIAERLKVVLHRWSVPTGMLP
jgi:uncharacterized protein YciI